MYNHKIVNADTGEETIVELSQDEIAVVEANIARTNAELAAEAAAQAAKESAQAKLAALGLTAAEIDALTK